MKFKPLPTREELKAAQAAGMQIQALTSEGWWVDTEVAENWIDNPYCQFRVEVREATYRQCADELEEALAAQHEGAVAWGVRDAETGKLWTIEELEKWAVARADEYPGDTVVPLYLHPSPPLSAEEVAAIQRLQHCADPDAIATVCNALRRYAGAGKAVELPLSQDFVTRVTAADADDVSVIGTDQSPLPANPTPAAVQVDGAARYRVMRDWFLRDGRRSEIAPHGHIKQVTTEDVDAGVDAIARKGNGE